MVSANIKIEMWYLDFMQAITKELSVSVEDGRVSGDKAVEVAVDAILKTIKHGVVVEVGNGDG